jgi:hypothetical protein
MADVSRAFAEALVAEDNQFFYKWFRILVGC